MLRLATVTLVLALIPGCKGMGGLASGLGHAASGLGHVASGLGHVASGVGHAIGPSLGHVASGVGHVASGAGHVAAAAGKVTSATLAHAAPAVAKGAAAVGKTVADAAPLIEDAAEVVALADPGTIDPDPVQEQEHTTSVAGPLIDDHDPCNRCPDDLSCDQCIGFNDVTCRYTPPNAFTRCESSN